MCRAISERFYRAVDTRIRAYYYRMGVVRGRSPLKTEQTVFCVCGSAGAHTYEPRSRHSNHRSDGKVEVKDPFSRFFGRVEEFLQTRLILLIELVSTISSEPFMKEV
jgi:hypothetical protein